MNKSSLLALNINGILVQVFFWFGSCSYMAFMVATLIDYGWSAGGAAAALTVMAVIAMIVQPFYGFICDKYFSEKILSVVLFTLSAVCFFLLPLSLRTGNMVLILVNMAGITVTGMQINGLLDSWIVGLKQEFNSINYGLIRGCGSFAYALAAQMMGIVTVRFSHDMRMWIGAGVLLFGAVSAVTFRSAKRVNKINAQHQGNIPVSRLKGIEALRLVFSSKQYNLLLAVSFFLLLCNYAIGTLLQILILEFSGTNAHIGTVAAVMAASEVPFMFLMAFFIKKLGYKKLIIISGIAYAVRMILTSSAGTVNSLIYIQFLQGLSYAVILPVSMNYFSHIVDERVRSTAVTIFTAVTASLTSILGNLITSAFLLNGFSAQSTLIFFVISALIGLILALYGSVRKIWNHN